MKKYRGLLVILIASIIAFGAVSWFVTGSVRQMNAVYKAFLDKDKVVRSYENHHGVKPGEYYRIQGYSGDGEIPERPSSFLVVTTIEVCDNGILIDNLELREIEVPKVEKDPVSGVYPHLFQKYAVFEVVNDVLKIKYLKDEEDLARHRLGLR